MNEIKSFISLTTTMLTMSFSGTKLSVGSAFFYECNGKVYLVTNRHNLTARDQNTGKPLSSHGGIPNLVEFSFPKYEIVENAIHFSGKGFQTHSLKLTANKECWLEHPFLGGEADIVAICFDDHFPGAQKPVFCVNTIRYSQQIVLQPAQNVSIVGYPYGTQVDGHYPVWVSGYLASEPSSNVEGKPAMYIDCRTNKGSSGSPVFAVAINGSVQVEGRPTSQGGATMMVISGTDGTSSVTFGHPVQRFIGIYSGRINDKADIGLVWRSSAIEEVCRNGIAAGPVD